MGVRGFRVWLVGVGRLEGRSEGGVRSALSGFLVAPAGWRGPGLFGLGWLCCLGSVVPDTPQPSPNPTRGSPATQHPRAPQAPKPECFATLVLGLRFDVRNTASPWSLIVVFVGKVVQSTRSCPRKVVSTPCHWTSTGKSCLPTWRLECSANAGVTVGSNGFARHGASSTAVGIPVPSLTRAR